MFLVGVGFCRAYFVGDSTEPSIVMNQNFMPPVHLFENWMLTFWPKRLQMAGVTSTSKSEKSVSVFQRHDGPVAVCTSSWDMPDGGRLRRECSRSTHARTQAELRRWAKRYGIVERWDVVRALAQLPA